MPDENNAVTEEDQKEGQEGKSGSRKGRTNTTSNFPLYFSESSQVFPPQLRKEIHPMYLVRKGKRNNPNITITRKHRVPEEKRKEGKGQKEAGKGGQLNEPPNAMINLGSHIYIYIILYI